MSATVSSARSFSSLPHVYRPTPRRVRSSANDYPPLDEEATQRLESGYSGFERLTPDDITTSQVYSTLSSCKEHHAIEQAVKNLVREFLPCLAAIAC